MVYAILPQKARERFEQDLELDTRAVSSEATVDSLAARRTSRGLTRAVSRSRPRALRT